MSDMVIQKAGPIAFTASQLLIFDGDSIQQRFSLDDIVAIRTVKRSSFIHPVLGGFLAVALLATSMYLFWNAKPDLTGDGDLYWAYKTLGQLIIAILSIFCGGVYLSYQLFTRRPLTWIELRDTQQQVHYFPMTGVSRFESDNFIRAASERIYRKGGKEQS